MTNQAILAVLDYLCNEARNSVHATQGLLQLLREREGSYREASHAIGARSSDKMLQFIDDARELASPEPQGEPDVATFDFAMAVGEIVEVLNLASRRHQARLEFRGPREPVMIAQDRMALEQALTRVLGAPRILSESAVVRVTVEPASNGVVLTVRANEPEFLSRVSLWLNSDPESEALQGPGDVPIGVMVMAAAKRIRRLGAEIRTSNEQLSIRVPSKTAADADLPAPDQMDVLNILVAEDCDESFALTGLLLRGERVRRAKDGNEAVELVKHHRFDVVLMDVHMDRMDGYTAIRAIRDWETENGNARTPVVVLSSDPLETQRRNAAQSGCTGFLRKPLRRNDLMDVLARLKELRATMTALS